MLRFTLVIAVITWPGLALGEPPAQSRPEMDAKLVARLVDQLGAPQFDLREAASRELLKLGTPAVRPLASAAKQHQSPEVRQRAKSILERLASDYNARPKVPQFDKTRVKSIVKRGGVVREKVSWSAQSSYHIISDLTVAAEGNLEIETGTVILLDNGVNIDIKGILSAQSKDEKQPIVLAPKAALDGREGYWGQLKLTDLGAMWLRNVEIRRSSGVHVVSENSCSLGNVSIYETAGDALRYDTGGGGGGVWARDVTIREATGAALVAHHGERRIDGLVVSGVRIGVKAFRGAPNLKSANIEYVRDFGIFAQDGSRPMIKNSRISNCAIGILYDHSYGALETSLVRSCSTIGVLIDNQSHPEVDDLTFESMRVSGLVVKGRSYPSLGKLREGHDFRGELTWFSPDSHPQILTRGGKP